MRIESGPTGERRVRTLLLFVMVAGFSGWFGYDGWVGYPKKNFEEIFALVPLEKREDARAQARVYPNATAAVFRQAEEAVRGSFNQTARRAALENLLGGPPSWEGPDLWYYFGPDFRITVSLKGGSPPTVTGQPTEKKAVDILLQKALAVGLGVVSVYVLVLLISVFTTRAVLDGDGLAYRGQDTVRWSEMQALASERFAAKGWVDLVYVRDGVERQLRLDEYHLAKFDDIIDALCRQKGFTNPLPLVRKSSPGDAPPSPS